MTETTTKTPITITHQTLVWHDERVCIKERFLDWYRFNEWLVEQQIKASLKEKRLQEKEANRQKLEEGRKKAAEVKEKQKRWSRGEFTPEELAERNRKKEKKKTDYFNTP